MEALEQLKSVLCDPEGNVCISGSDGDRKVISDALESLDQQVAALAKEVEKFEISYVLEQADHKRTSTELTAAQAREAKLRELWEAVEKEYFARLKEQDEEAAKFEAEKDMYGWNFHKGLRSGLVEFHIYMTKMVKALALPTDDSALQERLKEERERAVREYITGIKGA